MPEIARFYGIAIYIYFYGHNPPHLHARYGRSKAMFRLSDARLLRGELPPLATKLVTEWMLQHRDDLEANWKLAVEGVQPEKIVGPDGRE